MGDTAGSVLLFLLYSSAQLLILGGIAGVMARCSNIRGAFLCRISRFVIFLPLLTAIGFMLPHPALQLLSLHYEKQTNSAMQSFVDKREVQASRQITPVNLTLPDMQLDGFFDYPQTLNTFSIPKPADIPLESFCSSHSTLFPPAKSVVSIKAEGRSNARLKAAIFYGWFLAVCILLLYIGAGAAGVYRKVSLYANPVIEPAIIQLLSRCCISTNVKHPPALFSSEIHPIPFVLGFLCPVIVVPVAFLHPSKRIELQYTLLHELTHIRRKDSLWLPFERILHLLYFFHPVMHWTVRVLNKEREYLCDQQVVKVTNQKTEYAEFLLDTVWEYSKQKSNACVLPFADAPMNVSNRVKQILSGREKTMLEKVREIVVSSILIAAVVSLAVITAPAQEKNAGMENCMFAEPADLPGEYYLLPKVIEIQRIKVVLWDPKSEGAESFSLNNQQWEYNPETQIINIKMPVDNRKQRVLVFASQIVPWQFKARKPLKTNSVNILIGDRICEKDKDFFVDEQQGIIRIKDELCQNKTPCMMYYNFDGNNTMPERYAQGTRDRNGDPMNKNIFDPIIFKKFIDLPDDLIVDTKAVSARAKETKEPQVYKLTIPMDPEKMRIAIGRDSHPEDERWLKKGKEYTFDSEKSLITFLDKNPINPARKEYVRVLGVPLKDVFFYEGAISKGVITVRLNDKELKEDEGFIVDYEMGKIKILDPAVFAEDVHYQITGPGFGMER